MGTALLIKDFAPESFWQPGIARDAFPTLTWRAFLLDNLLPVTLGNVLGGALLVGVSYWFIYLRPRRLGRSTSEHLIYPTPGPHLGKPLALWS